MYCIMSKLKVGKLLTSIYPLLSPILKKTLVSISIGALNYIVFPKEYWVPVLQAKYNSAFIFYPL